MTRSRTVIPLLLAALLAAPLPASAESPDAVYLRQAVLLDNDPAAAQDFLASDARMDALMAEAPSLYQQVFARAAELKDLQGLLSGAYDSRSVRLALLKRPRCSFCWDEAAFAVWVAHYMPHLGDRGREVVGRAYWGWEWLREEQRTWLSLRGKADGWTELDLGARHERMREWALAERESLRRAEPKTEMELAALHERYRLAREVLGSHELTDVGHRLAEARQGLTSLAAAAARVAELDDPRLRALLAEAQATGDPALRLSALSRLFEGLGERPRDLLQAAPPRDDQRFDAESRRRVASLLRTALMKETQGTWAGADLKEFYAKTPMSVAFSTTSLNALGWYYNGADVLYFNERFIEGYIKSRGASVEDLTHNPALLRDLARTLVGTFVHEAQHHRQDVWRRGAGVSPLYTQGHEVEAFQVQALFLLEKMRRDKSFREFALREKEFSSVLRAGLLRARRMEQEGPSYFEWTVPSEHYPEVLSGEGQAWCSIVRHNNYADRFQAELDRRAALSAEERARLERGPPMADAHSSYEAYLEALRTAGTASLRAMLEEQRALAEKAPEIYRLYRERQEALALQTLKRYEMLVSGEEAGGGVGSRR